MHLNIYLLFQLVTSISIDICYCRNYNQFVVNKLSKTDLLKLIGRGESNAVEFKRSVTSDSMKDLVAFANTDGGVVIYGVENDGHITGLKERHPVQRISDLLSAITPTPKVVINAVVIDGRRLVCVHIDRQDQLHSIRHVVYVRLGMNNKPLDISEVIEDAAARGVIEFDLQESSAKIDEIDMKVFADFLRLRGEKRNLKSIDESDEVILNRLRFARGKRLTNGGVYIFHRDPDQYLINNGVQVVYFSDRENRTILDSKIFRGRLLDIIDNLESYFSISIPIHGKIIGWTREDMPLFPMELLREAVINALIHRNYFDNNENKIFISPRMIEIANPGGFLPGVNPDKPYHRSRNILLCQYLYEIGKIEKFGSGIPMMYKLAAANGLQLKYDITTYLTSLKIMSSAKGSLEDEILSLLRSQTAPVNISFLRDHIKGGINIRTLQRHLDRLVRGGHVLRAGRGKKTRYKA